MATTFSVIPATSADAAEHLPVFVYGTLQTGFKNHANVVRGLHSRAAAACLSGACVFHFDTGFPGMYPTPQPEGCCDGGELLGVYGGGAALNSVQALLDAAEAADRVRACTAGVVGQLLHFPEAAWPRMMADLDRLEAFEGPRNGRNMYERVRVRVRVLKHMTVTGSPQPGAGAAAPAGSPASTSTAEVASGAGATATATAVGADGGSAAGTEAEFVTAWTYFCLLDPATECMRSELVVDGHWRRHMRRGNLADGADEWADADGAAPESAPAAAAAAVAAPEPASTPSSSSASSAFSHEHEGAGAMPAAPVARAEVPDAGGLAHTRNGSAAGASAKAPTVSASQEAAAGSIGASAAAGGGGRYSMSALQRALRPGSDGPA